MIDMKKPDPGILSTAMALIESGNYREAETLLKPMIRDLPRDASVACLLGDCYAQFPNFEGAEYWYRQAISLQPYNPEYSIRYNRFRIDNLGALPKDRPRYLIGPIMGAAYAFANYADCVFFGGFSSAARHISEVEAFPGESIESILHKCPVGFIPDKIICLLPEYYAPPINIEKCGVKTVGIYTDLPAHSEMIALTASLFDVCLTQGFTQGPQMLIELGAKSAGTGFFIGDDPLFWVDRNLKRDIDILYLSTFSLPFIYRDRNKLISIILPLSSKYKIVIGSENQRNSAELSSRAKIVVNCSHSGRLGSEMIARRIFESMSCGALCFAEDNVEVVKHFYKDKSEIILYNENNLGLLLDNYLNSDNERARIAEAGREKTISFYSYAGNIQAIHHLLESGSGLQYAIQKRQISRAMSLLRKGAALFHSLHTKNWEGIVSSFQEAADQDPHLEGIVHNNLGVVAAHRGDYRKAGELFEKVAGHSGSHPIFVANRILNLIYLRKEYGLLDSLGNSGDLQSPDVGEATIPLYLICDAGGIVSSDKQTHSIYYLKIQDAILEYPERDYRFSARVDSIVRAEINKVLGFGFQQTDKFDKAREHYEKSLSEYRDDFDLLRRLSYCCSNLGDVGMALEFISEANRLQPLNMDILSDYYSLLFSSKRYAEIYASADLMLKADLRPKIGMDMIRFYKSAAAERTNDPHAAELINEFILSGWCDADASWFSNANILDVIERWKETSLSK